MMRIWRITLIAGFVFLMYVGGSPPSIQAQANGVPLRVKIKFTSTPDNASLFYPSGNNTRSTRPPVWLIMNLRQDSQVKVLFRKAGYKDCEVSFKYRWIDDRQAELIIGDEEQQFTAGSMRNDDAPIVNCELEKNP